jgi:hypothetical protein
VGGIVSGFDPGYGPNRLGGFGAYADLNIFHGLGVEGEARWLRINEFEGISQDNYLIGPRVRLHRIWRAQPYVKVLAGYSHMNFEENIATGRFTTIAFGGGVDFRVSRKLTFRPIDLEYQEWPQFVGNSLSPYGISVGMSYRIF